MKIFTHRQFDKQYKKLRSSERERFQEWRDIFLKNYFDPVLENHPLHGAYLGCRSINVGGDLRAVYRLIDSETAYFIAIGTHHELFGS